MVEGCNFSPRMRENHERKEKIYNFDGRVSYSDEIDGEDNFSPFNSGELYYMPPIKKRCRRKKKSKKIIKGTENDNDFSCYRDIDEACNNTNPSSHVSSINGWIKSGLNEEDYYDNTHSRDKGVNDYHEIHNANGRGDVKLRDERDEHAVISNDQMDFLQKSNRYRKRKKRKIQKRSQSTENDNIPKRYEYKLLHNNSKSLETDLQYIPRYSGEKNFEESLTSKRSSQNLVEEKKYLNNQVQKNVHMEKKHNLIDLVRAEGRVNGNNQITLPVIKTSAEGKIYIAEVIMPEIFLSRSDYIVIDPLVYRDHEGKTFIKAIKRKINDNRLPEYFESPIYLNDQHLNKGGYDIFVPFSHRNKNGELLVETYKTEHNREILTTEIIQEPFIRCSNFIAINHVVNSISSMKKYINVIKLRKNIRTESIENFECEEEIRNITLASSSDKSTQNINVWKVGGHTFQIVAQNIQAIGRLVNIEYLRDISSQKRENNSIVSLQPPIDMSNSIARTEPDLSFFKNISDVQSIPNSDGPIIYRTTDGKPYYIKIKKKLNSISDHHETYEWEEQIPEKYISFIPEINHEKLTKGENGDPVIKLSKKNKNSNNNDVYIEVDEKLGKQAIYGNDFIIPNQCIYKNREGITLIRVIRTRFNKMLGKFDNFSRFERINDSGAYVKHRKVIRERINFMNESEEFLIEDDTQNSKSRKIFAKCIRKRHNHSSNHFEFYECYFELPIYYQNQDGKYFYKIIRKQDTNDKNINDCESLAELTYDNMNNFGSTLPKYVRKDITILCVRKNVKTNTIEAYNQKEEVYEPEFIYENLTSKGEYVERKINIVKIRFDKATNKYQYYNDIISVYEEKETKSILTMSENDHLTRKIKKNRGNRYSSSDNIILSSANQSINSDSLAPREIYIYNPNVNNQNCPTEYFDNKYKKGKKSNDLRSNKSVDCVTKQDNLNTPIHISLGKKNRNKRKIKSNKGESNGTLVICNCNYFSKSNQFIPILKRDKHLIVDIERKHDNGMYKPPRSFIMEIVSCFERLPALEIIETHCFSTDNPSDINCKLVPETEFYSISHSNDISIKDNSLSALSVLHLENSRSPSSRSVSKKSIKSGVKVPDINVEILEPQSQHISKFAPLAIFNGRNEPLQNIKMEPYQTDEKSDSNYCINENIGEGEILNGLQLAISTSELENDSLFNDSPSDSEIKKTPVSDPQIKNDNTFKIDTKNKNGIPKNDLHLREVSTPPNYDNNNKTTLRKNDDKSQKKQLISAKRSKK